MEKSTCFKHLLDSAKYHEKNCILKSFYFQGAWFFCFDLVWRKTGESLKFSEWFEHEKMHGFSATLDDMKAFVIKEHMEFAIDLQKEGKVYDDPIKNMAFGELYQDLISSGEYLDYGDEFIPDYREFSYISATYLNLSILYENFKETISFISEYEPDDNPFLWLDIIRENITARSNKALGYWYANSQEVRGFVDKWQNQLGYVSKGGKTRATSNETIELWQNKAKELKAKGLSKRAIAEIIAKNNAEWSPETIRRKI